MKRYLNLFLTIVLSPWLASCGTGLTVPRPIKPNYVLDANGPQSVGYKDPRSNSLIERFISAYHISSCKSLGNELILPEIRSRRVFGVGRSIETDNLVVKKICNGPTHEDSSTQPDQGPATRSFSDILQSISEEEAAVDMTKAGFRLVDNVCDAYFRRIGNTAQDLEFYREGTNIISGTTAAVLGVAGASALSRTITATGFATLISGFDAYDTIYNFSPDVQSVSKLIATARKRYEDDLFDSDGEKIPENFDDAVKAVSAYQAICQTSYIRSLVTQSIDASVKKVEVTDQGLLQVSPN